MIEPSEEAGAHAASAPLPLDVLRNATSDCHRQLEAAIDWQGAFQSYETYRNLLERFALIVPGLEQAIAQQLAGGPPPEFDPDLRTGWLAADMEALTALGGRRQALQADAISPGQLAPEDFAYIADAPSAIGALYVLEGSTLGGQFLSRQLRERLQVTPEQGGSYFAAYGAATGRHWQTFRQWANAQLVDGRSTELAVAAAKRTFAHFGKVLAGLPR